MFSTTERLVPEDTDGFGRDLYVRAGGTTQLVSTGPTATNAATDATFDHASEDATVVLFHTTEHLTAGHVWSDLGYYRRAGANTDLIIPVDLNEQAFPRSSGDGSHAFYETDTPVLPDDTDFFYDVYQWHGGVTTRASTGPLDVQGNDASLGGTSFDGERVFFVTAARHVPQDTSSDWDVYERFEGQTALLTDNPVPQPGLNMWVEQVSPDGRQVLIQTRQSLDPADTDSSIPDAYLYTAPSPASSFWNVARADDFTRTGR